ncbi:MAG: sigma-70 family RNA polymerase sigma factor [Pseudomonadales bacterium]|nr:sigma-70 family RNA polymerase sigma factor [Pseudomonadales bacterium]
MLRESDEELISAAQAGNIAAFERLVRPVERQMLAVAAGIARNADDADDIFQEAMISAFRSISRFNGASQFSTWLHRIVVNASLSHRRRLKRLWRHSADLHEGEEYEEQHCHGAHTPEQSMLSAELNAQLNTALATLSERERIAFVLCHQQEFRIREAAEIMEASENSIKVYLFRAREKLRNQLDPYYRPDHQPNRME